MKYFRVALFTWADIYKDRYVLGHNILKGTDLDSHSFCCFEVASMHSLIEAEGSISDNGPYESGNRLKYQQSYKTASRYKDNVITWVCKQAFYLIVRIYFWTTIVPRNLFSQKKASLKYPKIKTFENNLLHIMITNEQ